MSTITVPRVRRILDFLLHGRSRRNRPGHALADRNLAMKALPAVQPRRAFLMRTGVITGGNLSLGSLVGFVTLFGITLRNSIMLISHYEHLVNVECMRWGAETALRGASERLAPILMTALVTGLGLLPLAIGSGDPGREIEGPMAIVILGDLVTSTVLNLLVLPTLALRHGSFERIAGVKED